jgi:hypothetical protein
MNILKLSIIPVVALAAMIATPTFAAEKKSPTKDTKDKKFFDEVTAVDSKSISIYHSPTKEEKYTVTDATKVTVDYKPAKIEDVKVGMKATVSKKPDSDEATSINASTVKKGKGK